jgi:hypothetical protein
MLGPCAELGAFLSGDLLWGLCDPDMRGSLIMSADMLVVRLGLLEDGLPFAKG